MLKLYIFMIFLCLNLGINAIESFLENEYESVIFLDNNTSKWLDQHIDDKLYLKSECIAIENNKINMIINDVVIPINHLGVDCIGIYTHASLFGWWKCDRCQYYNSPTVNTCQNCLKYRND